MKKWAGRELEQIRSESDTHKWLIFCALRRCQWPSRLSSLLRNQTCWIDPWRNAVVSLRGEHRRHERIAVLSGHHVRRSLLSRVGILLREELLLRCSHSRHGLMRHVLAICGVGESGILRSQQLLENRKRRGKINEMQFK